MIVVENMAVSCMMVHVLLAPWVAAMEPIEKLLLNITVIGVVGFVTTVVYLTHY